MEAFGVVLAIVVGVVAAGAGALTCHEDVGSSDQAPNLCSSVGNETALWLPPVLGPGLVLLLLLVGLRTRVLALAIVVIVAAEAGLVVMWALVSHGTIHY
jgi:hypothetical protein